MNDTYFVTGISTEVGKTISSAIVVESLQADYWKPIQSGDLDNSDTMKVKSLISNSISTFFPSSYEFDYPASPHLSAQMEGRHIELAHIKRNTILDLMLPTDKIVLVSRHYLGSINHTMLSVEALQRRGLNIFGIIFSGEENTATESWIASYTQIPIIGRIEEEPFFDKNTIKKYADLFKKNLK